WNEASRRRFTRTAGSDTALRIWCQTPEGCLTPLLEDQRSIRDRPTHPDPLINANRRRVLRPHEQADRRHLREQPATQIPHRPLRITAVAQLRIDPHLL